MSDSCFDNPFKPEANIRLGSGTLEKAPASGLADDPRGCHMMAAVAIAGPPVCHGDTAFFAMIHGPSLAENAAYGGMNNKRIASRSGPGGAEEEAQGGRNGYAARLRGLFVCFPETLKRYTLIVGAAHVRNAWLSCEAKETAPLC